MSRSSQSKRVALITGCSEPTSLGVAMVKQLHEQGWQVIATARKVETMEALEAIGITVRYPIINDTSL
jgi:NADP-dependent 3-hydroxy acid dehydrogenase YdfG